MKNRYIIIAKILMVFFSIVFADAMESEDKKYRDISFGSNSIAFADFAMSSGTFNDIVPSIHVKVQSDGKIVMLGDAYKDFNIIKTVDSRFALARFNEDGILDTGFGIGGKLLLEISKLYCFGIDLALQNDGKMVIVGRSYDHTQDFPDAIIMRLNNDGSFDNSFGKNGIKKNKNSKYNWSNFFRIALQGDGKMVVVGNQGKMIPRDDTFDLDYCTFFTARYKGNGKLDSSFGKKGKVKTVLQPRLDKRPADEAYSVKIQSDRKILVIGRYEDAVDNVDMYEDGSKSTCCALVRYESNGSLDTTFGSNKSGIVITKASNYCNFFVDAAIQSDGAIIAVGSAQESVKDYYNLLIARYTQDGILDTSFGGNDEGIVITSLGTDIAFKSKNIALQKDGKIMVTGMAKLCEEEKFALVRYTKDGILDETFGDEKSGSMFSSLRGYKDRSYAVALQDDEKIIIAGESFNGEYFDFTLMRYNAL